MPPDYRDFAIPAQWLSFDELERVARLFASLGVSRLRLTGGEPLTRGRLPELAARLTRIEGITDLSLSTNATRLARHAPALAAAGVRRVNVSLDTLDAARFRRLTGRDALGQVLAGLDAASAFGMSPVKINTVVLADTTDAEIDALVEFCMARGFVLRLIEPMPLGDASRGGRVDLQPVRIRLRQRYALVDGLVPGGGPARYMQTADGRFSLGFITPLSQHFCATCNRVRLTVDGDLYLCLGNEDRVALRPLLRGGASDAELLNGLCAALQHKPRQHHFGDSGRHLIRIMSRTGG